MIEQYLLEKYPFLPDAKKSIGENENQIPNTLEKQQAISKAIDSVKLNLQTKNQGVKIFALARLFVSMLDNDYYLIKFCQTESSRATKDLREENETDFFKVVCAMFSSLEKNDGENYTISIIDFLNSSNGLEQCQISKGKIILSKEQLINTFKKSVFQRIRNLSKIPQNSQVRNIFKDEVAELLSQLPKPPVISDFKGKYLSLPCVKNSIEHTPEGKRYYACLSICIACKKDGLSMEQAEKVLERFVENSGKTVHPFTIKEALATLSWTYKKTPNFSCKMQRANGLAGTDICKSPCEYETSRLAIRRK